MGGIGIITNPHSKLNKRNPNRQQLLSFIAGKQGRLEITNNLEELQQAAREFKRNDIEILAINGGDGTISLTISAFIKAYEDKPLPAIALLRGGTMNMLADNLGIRGSPEELLFKLIESHSLGAFKKTTSLRTLKVNDTYGFLYADGTSARFLEIFYKNKTNGFGVIKLLASIIFSWLKNSSLYNKIVYPQTIYVTPDDNRTHLTLQSLSLFAATVEKLPMKIPFFSHHEDNLMNVVCISSSASKLPLRLPVYVFANKNESLFDKQLIKCHSLKVSSKNKIIYTLDGELFYPQDSAVEIKLGPSLNFVIT